MLAQGWPRCRAFFHRLSPCTEMKVLGWLGWAGWVPQPLRGCCVLAASPEGHRPAPNSSRVSRAHTFVAVAASSRVSG